MTAAPYCTRPACRQGRAACHCSTGQPMPAEACTELGAHAALPLHGSGAAYMLAPLIDRWPRFTALAALILLVLLLGLVGEPPVEILAADHLPGDGFPPELLALKPIAAASEARP